MDPVLVSEGPCGGIWLGSGLIYLKLFIIVLKERDDKVTWKLGNKGFTIKSWYNALQVRQPVKLFKDLWKMKLPWKSKIFLWVVMWGKTLTKVNLGMRGWGIHSIHVLCI
jgi:hypothetical protein